jgi:hypothetical protein
MRSRLVLLLLSSFVLGACSDTQKKHVDSGVDAGVDSAIVVTPTTMCTETYSSLDRATLATLTTSGVGACSNDADLDAACAGDLETAAGTCGTSCYLGHPGDEPGFLSCTTSCLQEMAKVRPSDACTSCFVQSVACVAQHCLADCIAGPTAPACLVCQAMSGCRTSFFDCSGLPSDLSAIDGGVADGGSDSAVDAGDDSGLDAGDDAGVDAGDDAGTGAAIDDAGTDAAVDAG